MVGTARHPPKRLIEQHLPRFDAHEVHEVAIQAPTRTAYQAILSTNLRSTVVIRPLLLLRALPSLLSTPWFVERTNISTFRALLQNSRGFFELGERPGEELLIGVVGRFWTMSGGVRQIEPAEFAGFAEPGYAKAVWNFHVRPDPSGGTLLSTETRVLCMDPGSRRRFMRYWRLIRPWSGLIRSDLLAAIRRQAEQG